ncbi:hypothetical protein GCM10022222_84860 [Amycolatopsis ultiminotia]|uniref:Uncharacterized protein n=1 Tax=Amycolatopsis ultiminotia TaxID=543629 RepID=A0ABP6YT94_9PSEU
MPAFAAAVSDGETAVRRREERLAKLETQLERKLDELAAARADKEKSFAAAKDAVRADAAGEIKHARIRMGQAIQQIRESDLTVTEVAELLGIAKREVTALVRTAESADARSIAHTGPRSRSDGAPGTMVAVEDQETVVRGGRSTSGPDDVPEPP